MYKYKTFRGHILRMEGTTRKYKDTDKTKYLHQC